MRAVRSALLAAVSATFLVSCRPQPGPALGPLAGVKTVAVELALETRPAFAGAVDGRCSVEVVLGRGHLVLASGWQADEAAAGASSAFVQASFERRDGSLLPLAEIRLHPAAGETEGWRETAVAVPAELVGVPGRIVFTGSRPPRGWKLFTALPRAVPERGNRPNLILISIDTLRADGLGSYGNPRPASPAIDAMAREGTRFRNALAQSSWTLPSHYTMLTSLYPSVHGVNPDRRLFAGIRGSYKTASLRGSESDETLAERLSDLGYFTSAITEDGWLEARFGFDQGFASYLAHHSDNLAEATARLTLDWLRRHRDLPFFLFVHTYQTHQPYHQPAPYDTMFVDPHHVGYALPGVPLPMAVFDQFKRPTFPPMPADVAAFRGLYDGEVRYVDAFIAELLATIRAQGLERDTIVLFTSDHGEELFEHGNFDHGETLYDEVLRVPFILWGPGRIPAGQTPGAPVALLDILPTLVELAGGKAGGRIQGKSLVPLLAGHTGGFAGRALFAEGYATVFHHRRDQDESVPLTCVWDGADKLILRRSRPESAELFDLRRDPAESRDLAAEDPRRVAHLRERIRAWEGECSRLRRPRAEKTKAGLDAETEKKLRSLGYL